MATLEVDFDVYKALTVRRPSESVTYNDVMRELLGLGGASAKEAMKSSVFQGLVCKGVEFAEGTQFRATHKGKTYTGAVKNGVWVDSKGTPQSSPSSAAHQITGGSTNGWWFWECSRPSDPTWIVIGNLRK